MGMQFASLKKYMPLLLQAYSLAADQGLVPESLMPRQVELMGRLSNHLEEELDVIKKLTDALKNMK